MEDKQDLLQEAYEAWIMHPITKELLKNLDKHKASLVTSASAFSIDTEITDAAVRRFMVCVRNTDAIIFMINTYEIFKDQVNKK